MPPVNYHAGRPKQTTKPCNETTRLLEATKIERKWKGKGRARKEKDLEAQTPIAQFDGPSNSRQKGDKGEKSGAAAAVESGQESPISSGSGPSQVSSPGSPISRYYQNSIIDDWPTSCTMITVVLTLGAVTLLLIVFFGNLEIRRPKI